MATGSSLRVDLEPRAVTLHYPGAEGVVFEDAVLVLRNTGAEPVADPMLRLVVEQEGKGTLYDGEVAGPDLGSGEPLAPGEERGISVFRLLQDKSQGFASRVNLFGYKSALGWDFRVVATARVGSEGEGTEPGNWSLRWEVSPEQPGTVRLRLK